MILSVAILVLLVGVTLAARGIRGRRFADDAPRCRRCGYDLRAAAAERCPECGTSLASRRAIRRDRVWRRPRLTAAGTALSVLGIATVFLDRGGRLDDRMLDRLTPTAWLLWRAEHDRGATLSESVDLLQRRLSLQPERFSEVQRLRTLDRLVRLHGDPAARWRSAWCEPIEEAFVVGTLPPEMLARYLDSLADSLGVTLDRTELTAGAPVRPSYVWTTPPRVRANHWTTYAGKQIAPLWAIDGRFAMRLGGVQIADQRASRTPDGFLVKRPDDPSDWVPHWGYIPRVPRDILEKLAPGPQTLEIELTLDVQDTSRRSRGTLHSMTRSVRIPVTLRAATTEPSG